MLITSTRKWHLATFDLVTTCGPQARKSASPPGSPSLPAALAPSLYE